MRNSYQKSKIVNWWGWLVTVQLNCVTVMCHCKSGRAVSKRDQRVTCFALLSCTARLPCSARPTKRNSHSGCIRQLWQAVCFCGSHQRAWQCSYSSFIMMRFWVSAVLLLIYTAVKRGKSDTVCILLLLLLKYYHKSRQAVLDTM